MLRRPPRRPPIPPRRRRPDPVPPRPSRRLIRANALMEEGRHREAARLFARLSAGARSRGMPVRAAYLALRASHAFLSDRNPAEAVEHLQEALHTLVRRGRVRHAAHAASRAATRLREEGFESEAAQLEQWMANLRQDSDVDDADWEAQPADAPELARRSLPERCTGCGAPVVPDEVIWHHAQRAECPYCGSIISAG